MCSTKVNLAERIKRQRHGIVQKLDSPLISKEEIKDMLTNELLHNNNEHHVIYNDGSSVVDVMQSHPRKVELLQSSYNNGSTIKISYLENWSKTLRSLAHSLGTNTTIHLFLSPDKGSAFGYHADDNDVLIHMQYGKKRFFIWYGGEEVIYELSAGDVLLIPRGVAHKAENMGASAHLSVGLQDPMVTSERFDSLPIDFNLGDL